MILKEAVARVIEFAAKMLGAHGLKAGAIATLLVCWYHIHHISAWVRSAMATVRIASAVGAALGIGLLVALAQGWLDIEAVPVVPELVGGLLDLLPLVAV